MAGLIAALENGLMAMELDSAVASDLAVGASGRARRAVEALEDSEATALARSGESVAGGLVPSEFGSHIRRRAADSNKEHLSVAGRGEEAATPEAYLYQGTGVTGPLVTFCVVLKGGSRMMMEWLLPLPRVF